MRSHSRRARADAGAAGRDGGAPADAGAGSGEGGARPAAVATRVYWAAAGALALAGAILAVLIPPRALNDKWETGTAAQRQACVRRALQREAALERRLGYALAPSPQAARRAARTCR
jgi:hypothetical protein